MTTPLLNMSACSAPFTTLTWHLSGPMALSIQRTAFSAMRSSRSPYHTRTSCGYVWYEKPHGSRSWLRIWRRSLCVPLADSACEAAMSAFPSATWKLCADVGVVGAGVGVLDPLWGWGDCKSESEGDEGLVAVMDIDRRPVAREGDTVDSSVRSREGRSLGFIDLGDGDRDFWNAEFQSNWSRPRPTSTFSGVDGGGIHGGVGVGGSDIFVVLDREPRPFKEPIERSALSFFPVLPPDLSTIGLCGCWLLEADLNRPRKPRDVFREGALDVDLHSLMVRFRPKVGGGFCPMVLRLSNRPSKSRRSSYSENAIDDMLGRG